MAQFCFPFYKANNMKKQDEPDLSKDIKPDLKHDTMEFSAATDGDDQLDTDDATYEEEGISAEELDNLEDDDLDSQAYALDSAETDKLSDEDTLPEENWEQDLPDEDADENNNEEDYKR